MDGAARDFSSISAVMPDTSFICFFGRLDLHDPLLRLAGLIQKVLVDSQAEFHAVLHQWEASRHIMAAVQGFILDMATAGKAVFFAERLQPLAGFRADVVPQRVVVPDTYRFERSASAFLPGPRD